MRWLVLVWLVVTTIALLLLAGSLIWIGWFAEVSRPLPADLPRWAFPLFALPLAVAVTGYGFAIWRLWRRRPAVTFWLIGLAGHLTYLVAEVMISGGIDPSNALSWFLESWIPILVPGAMLLMIERDRLMNPLSRP
jgi:hypothetical protein